MIIKHLYIGNYPPQLALINICIFSLRKEAEND